MKQINAQEILDITLAGTSATLLARRWESALLVNVDNETLQRLLDNEEAMKALMNIESFRSLNKDIQTIIAKSEKIKKFKGANTKPSEKVKKMISDEDRELKSKRKEIQKQLIKFATRIPVFMYLTDFRERSLRDIITQLEPTLFKKVTGIAVKDFELLCSLGVFNSSHMNDAIFKFKRYEDESLSYSGIDKRPLLEIGGWDTTIKREEYDKLFHSQQETMSIRVKSTEAPKALTNHQTSSYVLKTDTTVITNLEQETLTELETAIPNIKINSKVNHKKFGTGIVAKLDKKEKYITVSFGKAEKKFIYPNAFLDGFLTKSND